MSKPVLYLELQELLNKHSREDESNTPDFTLASFMLSTLKAFESATKERDRFHSINVLAFSKVVDEQEPTDDLTR